MLKDTLENNLSSEIEDECNCEEPRRMDCAQGDWCKRCGEFIFSDRIFKESPRAIRRGETETSYRFRLFNESHPGYEGSVKEGLGDD